MRWAHIPATAEITPTHNLRYTICIPSWLWVIALRHDKQEVRYQCFSHEKFTADVEHCSLFYLTPKQHTGPECKITLKAVPTHAGAAGRVIIWRHLKPIFLKLFRPRARFAKVDSVCPNCGHHNSVYSVDVSASYRLVPREAARLACSLVRSCSFTATRQS